MIHQHDGSARMLPVRCADGDVTSGMHLASHPFVRIEGPLAPEPLFRRVQFAQVSGTGEDLNPAFIADSFSSARRRKGVPMPPNGREYGFIFLGDDANAKRNKEDVRHGTALRVDRVSGDSCNVRLKSTHHARNLQNTAIVSQPAHGANRD